jgi:2,5-dioxopentanoate dehydrogenase
VHPGLFSLIKGGNRAVGEALVQHPLVQAVGFTGFLAGGRALFDLCAGRPVPVPFFGELGSINPMFLLPAALAKRGRVIAEGRAASLTMGAGQFCTNPGLAFMVDGPDVDRFLTAAAEALAMVPAQTTLTDGMAQAFRDGRGRMASAKGVRPVVGGTCTGRMATPQLFQASGDVWFSDHSLAEEVFGPLGLVVRLRDTAEMERVARNLQGQLTCTLQMDAEDQPLARALLPILTRKAGRILANGCPTGVEVADAMVHGGPFPASTNFGHTSVGTLSIRRWLRPVCYQNFPDALLPSDVLPV